MGFSSRATSTRILVSLTMRMKKRSSQGLGDCIVFPLVFEDKSARTKSILLELQYIIQINLLRRKTALLRKTSL